MTRIGAFGEVVIINGITVSDTTVFVNCCVSHPTIPGVVTGRWSIRSRGGVYVPHDPEDPVCDYVERQSWDASGSFDPIEPLPWPNGVVATRHRYFLDPNTCQVFTDTATARLGGEHCVPMDGSPGPFPLIQLNTSAIVGNYSYVRRVRQRGLFEQVMFGGGNPSGSFYFVHDLMKVDYTPPCPNPSGRGACCCSGVCVDCWTQAECAAAHGTWQGAGSTCFDVSCRPTGRCCIPGFGCAEMPEVDCVAAGGTWTLGVCATPGEPCESVPPQLPPGAGRSALMFVPLIGGRF